MGVYVGLKQNRRKKQKLKKPTTIKVFVDEGDLPEGCGRTCAQHCAKVLRKELHGFFTNYFFDVRAVPGADDYNLVYDVEEPDRVMDTIDSMASYVEHVLKDPGMWCQCNKMEE
jgi:hypothetical protein